jgi:hypothetical protein
MARKLNRKVAFSAKEGVMAGGHTTIRYFMANLRCRPASEKWRKFYLTWGALFLLSCSAYAWDWGGAQAPADSASAPPPSVYIGPVIGGMMLSNDFDGDHVLTNKLTGQTAAVPQFSASLSYGGTLGIRLPIAGAPVDLGLEINYLEAHLRSSPGPSHNPYNNHDGLLHEVGISGKGYFQTHRTLQPFLAAGYDIPWMTIAGGVQTTPGDGTDEHLRGGGFHAGAGVCWFARPELALEMLVTFHQRRFTSMNSDTIQETLISNTVEPTLSLTYHFRLGGKHA